MQARSFSERAFPSSRSQSQVARRPENGQPHQLTGLVVVPAWWPNTSVKRSECPLKPYSSDQAAEIGQKYGKVLHDLPGHVSTVMFVDEDSLMSITTSDTEQFAEAVKATRHAAQRDLTDILAAPRTVVASTLVHDVR